MATVVGRGLAADRPPARTDHDDIEALRGPSAGTPTPARAASVLVPGGGGGVPTPASIEPIAPEPSAASAQPAPPDS
ncbi:MAG: hypothetical protein ACXVII_36075 [Solirubrobacteraceae bacterium]